MGVLTGIVLSSLIVFVAILENDSHLKNLCQQQVYAELTFYDPTLPEPQRWDDQNILIQLGHPTQQRCPISWFRWEIKAIDAYAWHNQWPSIGNAHLPNLDPPIILSDGSKAYSLKDLEQVRTQ